MIAPILSGIAAGFLYCLPVSSVNVEIIRRGLHNGFSSAFAVSMGAIVGDLVWFVLAVTGATWLESRPEWQAAVGFGGAAILMGIAWSAYRSGRRPATLAPAAPRSTGRDFVVGAAMCLANPFAVLVLLSMMASFGRDHLAAGGSSRTWFYAGLFLGPVMYGLAFSGLASWGRRFVTPRRLQVVDLGAAAVMAGLGILLAWHAVGALRG